MQAGDERKSNMEEQGWKACDLFRDRDAGRSRLRDRLPLRRLHRQRARTSSGISRWKFSRGSRSLVVATAAKARAVTRSVLALVLISALLQGCPRYAAVSAPEAEAAATDIRPARDYLTPSDYEDRAYAAFGYLLFGRAPAGDQRAARLLQAWLELPQAPEMVETYGADPDGLMQVLLPCRDPSACRNATDSTALAAEYDLERSQTIAQRNSIPFPIYADHVPMLVVLSIEPIAERPPTTRPTIVDFSKASQQTVVARFRDLMVRVGQPSTWNDVTMTSVVADLHDILNEKGETLCWVSSVLPGGAKLLSLALGSDPAAVCIK
jgi:hypothetical protein